MATPEPYREWISPNGVNHAVVRGRCVTCGRLHPAQENIVNARRRSEGCEWQTIRLVEPRDCNHISTICCRQHCVQMRTLDWELALANTEGGRFLAEHLDIDLTLAESVQYQGR